MYAFCFEDAHMTMQISSQACHFKNHHAFLLMCRGNGLLLKTNMRVSGIAVEQLQAEQSTLLAQVRHYACALQEGKAGSCAVEKPRISMQCPSASAAGHTMAALLMLLSVYPVRQL